MTNDVDLTKHPNIGKLSGFLLKETTFFILINFSFSISVQIFLFSSDGEFLTGEKRVVPFNGLTEKSY